MPSGRTHDRITLWSLPFAAGLTFGLTRSGNLTLMVSGGYLFSGLMFGPDLDIHSRQFIRWGWLRCIWIPYQKTLRHRSIFSHGPVIGTVLRVLYLSSWLLLVGLLGLGVSTLFWGAPGGRGLFDAAWRALFQYRSESIALFVGLELGAMSHSVSDWGGSAYKRFKRGGFRAVIPQVSKKKLKRKSTSRKSKSLPQRIVKKRTAEAQRTQRRKRISK